VVALGRAAAHGVGRRRDAKVKLGVGVERAVAQSWSCDGDGGGDSAHGGGGAHSMMRAEVATLGLAQDRCGGQSETVAASESVYVIVAVVVELYNASVAAAAAVVVVAAVAAAVACAVSILFPADLSARSLLCHVHPARTWARRDARFQSLASSH
jgi:hypothetical protein